ncbi:unnamed protein product [Closterium sp. Yama58-4]|nr:unnamed protein product [Closterium sp. Yama58-4]
MRKSSGAHRSAERSAQPPEGIRDLYGAPQFGNAATNYGGEEQYYDRPPPIGAEPGGNVAPPRRSHSISPAVGKGDMARGNGERAGGSLAAGMVMGEVKNHTGRVKDSGRARGGMAEADMGHARTGADMVQGRVYRKMATERERGKEAERVRQRDLERGIYLGDFDRSVTETAAERAQSGGLPWNDVDRAHELLDRPPTGSSSRRLASSSGVRNRPASSSYHNRTQRAGHARFGSSIGLGTGLGGLASGAGSGAAGSGDPLEGSGSEGGSDAEDFLMSVPPSALDVLQGSGQAKKKPPAGNWKSPLSGATPGESPTSSGVPSARSGPLISSGSVPSRSRGTSAASILRHGSWEQREFAQLAEQFGLAAEEEGIGGLVEGGRQGGATGGGGPGAGLSGADGKWMGRSSSVPEAGKTGGSWGSPGGVGGAGRAGLGGGEGVEGGGDTEDKPVPQVEEASFDRNLSLHNVIKKRISSHAGEVGQQFARLSTLLKKSSSTPNAPGSAGSGASSGGKRPAQEGKKPPKPAKSGSDRPSSGNPLARTSSMAAEFGDLPAPKRTHYQYSELQDFYQYPLTRFSIPIRPPSSNLLLQLATENFNEANVLGQGGFGKVYYGVLPVHPAQVVAVKVLKQGGGEQGDEEFVTELELLSRLEHKHLVKLMGYCMRKNQRLLVYEFLPNGSLADHLHGKKVRQNGPLSWEKRLKIAVGSARGLRYLHSQRPQVLHRDVKAPNILITDSYVAKVADFGCAKLIKQTILVEDPNTGEMVETLGENVDVAMGTHGHMAPEILMTGEISAATDVYR